MFTTPSRTKRQRLALALGLPLALGLLIAGFGTTRAQDAQLGQHAFYQPLPEAAGPHYAYGYEANQILEAGVVDLTRRTVTLPLYRGSLEDGRAVWYVVTDVSDEGIARQAGINYAPKLANATGTAVRTATVGPDGRFVFDKGAVDFAPERQLVPGDAPDFFPPKTAQPGSVGDADYTPLVRVGNHVYNASTVAFDVEAEEIEFPDGGVDYTKVIDRAVAISPAEGTVTLSLALGTVAGRPVLFIALESNHPFVSTAEATTRTPALDGLSFGADDRVGSDVAVNYIAINGPTGDGNPQIQGVNSALSDETGQVLDIFDSAPGLREGYSPMWDLYLGWWTQDAIDQGYRARVESELEWLTLVEQGWITGQDGTPVGTGGIVSNCPLVISW